MAQNTLIARAGRGLLDVLTLLMRGVGAACAAIGAIFLAAASAYEPNASSGALPGEEEAMPDGLSMIERDEIAQSNGWNSW